MRRSVLFALFVSGMALASSAASAQILSVPNKALRSDPSVFFSGGLGILSVQALYDGATGTAWNFSQALQYNAAVEFALSRGSAFGVAASYANVPLAYDVETTSPYAPLGTNRGTYSQIDAHVNVYTIAGQYTLGAGSQGFHQVVVINAGIIAFENFSADRGGSRLAPTRDIDPLLSIGYGAGYGFGTRAEAFVVQEYGVSLHQSTGLSGSDSRQYQQQTTRIGIRYGVGSRR